MRLGLIGVGRMGGGIAQRLIAGGHECVAFDIAPDNLRAAGEAGAEIATSMRDLVRRLEPPRSVLLSLRIDHVEATFSDLLEEFDSGDVILDLGNSLYTETVRRSSTAAERGVKFLDVGVSGGLAGAERGYCVMVGGERTVYDAHVPAMRSLAVSDDSLLYCGPSGAGHLVKTIHNAIEYGIMQAYAEGFELLRAAASKNDLIDDHDDLTYDLNLSEIANAWRHGSLVSSPLLGFAAAALARDSELDEFKGSVGDNETARWAVRFALGRGAPVPAIANALFARFRSTAPGRSGGSHYSDRFLSALRDGFGGHAEASTPDAAKKRKP